MKISISRCPLPLISLMGLMMPYGAASSSAHTPMTTGIMTNDAASHGATEAAFGKSC